MKRFRSGLVGLLVVVLLALSPVSAFASNSSQQNALSKSQFDELKKNALIAAQDYVNTVSTYGAYEPWALATITYKFPLFDFNDNVTAFFFEVDNSNGDAGYLIVSAADPVVIEAAREGNGPYSKESKSEKAIYVGPTQYFIKKSSEEYYDIRNKRNETKANFKTQGTLAGVNTITDSILKTDEPLAVTQGLNKASNVGTSSIVSYSSKTISTVPDFEWRKGCSPTSFSNIIWYYRYNHGYTSLLASTTTSTTLIDVLAGSSYMNTDSTGKTDWNNRVTGMVKFWNDRGWNVTVTRTSASFSTHRTQIDNNKPTIINTVGDATYDNHDMTGIGYEEYQRTEEIWKWYRYVIVRDTWPDTPSAVYLYLDSLSWNETVTVSPGSART